MNAFVFLGVSLALVVPVAAADAKTIYQDLHDFAGGPGDGDTPISELIVDSQGRVYGTTFFGGSNGNGTVFRITLPKTKTRAATTEILHSFLPGEGVGPEGGVLIGADGALYGTTNTGGAHNDGTVYRLDPQTFALTTLHDFSGGSDGSAPVAGLTAGPGGLLYGTTGLGGPEGGGIAFAISPKGDGVSYKVIHGFGGTGDGNEPYIGRLVSKGNKLFGVTINGGSSHGFGAAFELVQPAGKSIWKETVLYEFGSKQNDVITPESGLVMDKAGALYGCANGGQNGRGAVYSLTPAGGSAWTETLIASFGLNAGDPDDAGECSVAFDKAGRLVGTTNGGGTNGQGAVFTLTQSGGTWTLATVLSFGTGGVSATNPFTGVIPVAQGYYAGSAPTGGANAKGAVYRVKP